MTADECDGDLSECVIMSYRQRDSFGILCEVEVFYSFGADEKQKEVISYVETGMNAV